MDELKKFQKRAFTIGATGIGLSAMIGASSDSPDTVKALGNMGKGLGMMGNLSVMGTSLNMLGKIKKKG